MKKVTLVMQFLGAACIVSSLSILITGCGGDSTVTTNQTTVTTTTVPSNTTTVKPTVNANISISAVPSVQTAKPGDKFDVMISAQTDKPTRGMQFSLKWDPTKVECISAEQGGYFKDFAATNEGELFIMPSANPVADNMAGIFPKTNDPLKRLMIALTGARAADGTAMGVTGQGDIFILHMNVKAEASGKVDFTLSQVTLGDTGDSGSGDQVSKDLKPAVINGKITIAP